MRLGNIVKVVIADDHSLVRRGIRTLLEQNHEIDIVGEAADGQEAVSLAQTLQPDVLIMDLAMPRLDGLRAMERIRELNIPTKVLILSTYASSILVEGVLRRGARGYVLKRSAAAELLPAIRQVMQGKVFLSQSLSAAAEGELLA